MVYRDPFLHVFQMSKNGLLLSHRTAQQVPVHPRVLLQKGRIITQWWKKNKCFFSIMNAIRSHFPPPFSSALTPTVIPRCCVWLLAMNPSWCSPQFHPLLRISLLLEVTLQRNSCWCTALTLITLSQKQLQNTDFLWLAKKPKLWSLALPVSRSEQNSTKLQRVFVFPLSTAVKYACSDIRYLMNKYIATLAFTHQLC